MINTSCSPTPNFELQRVQGDDWEIPLNFWADKDRTIPLDITGYTVFFTMKKKVEDSDDDAVFKTEVTAHTDPEQGKTVILVPEEDTASIPLNTYKYDIQYKDTLGRIKTPLRGDFKVVWQATERTA